LIFGKQQRHPLALHGRCCFFTQKKPKMSNIFNTEYKKETHRSFIEGLKEHARAKSYYEKRKTLYSFSIVISYLFSFWSGLTAAFAVFSLCQFLFKSVVLSAVAALIGLVCFEKFKRLSANDFYETKFFEGKTALNWLFVLVVMFAASVAVSSLGTKSGVNAVAPSAFLLAKDSTLRALILDIEKIENENADLSENKNREGIIFFPSQESIAKNKSILVAYSLAKLELEKELRNSNVDLTESHRADVDNLGWILVFITVVFEILFHLFLGYKWHYKKRCFDERGAIDNEPDNVTVTPVSENNNVTLNAANKPITATVKLGKNIGNNVVITEDNAKDNAPKTSDNVYPLALQNREEFETTDEFIDYLLEERMKKQRTYNGHKSKFKNGIGNAVTNEKAMHRNASHMHQIDLILAFEKSEK
jgi:hypothetical protein